MVNATLERAWQLKQALIDFVLDAEGEGAIALETYAAAHAPREQADVNQRELVIDSFAIEGKVGDKTPLDLFLETQSDLPESESPTDTLRDRHLLETWRHSFIGLFEITQILPDGFELMNWLTAKHYLVQPNNPSQIEKMARLQVGEILLTRIAPLTNAEWMLFGAYIAMGKLGNPKLAVAIGNFKKNYKPYLYSDAPDLLELSWESVAQYHQEFVEFFGGDRLTLSGYQLNKKIAELQEKMTDRFLTAAGIDDSKSLQDIARESGVNREELAAAAAETGADSKEIAKLLDSSEKIKMAFPKVELPDAIKKAEEVTVFSHPRWGQTFLPTYNKFKAILEAENWQSIPNADKMVRHYLEDATTNFYIWQQLAQQYPTQLEKVLQTFLGRPDFSCDRDLEALLKEYNKPSEPELPETASIPRHLHNLFEEAVAEVNKSKSQSKGQKKTTKGFQRSRPD